MADIIFATKGQAEALAAQESVAKKARSVLCRTGRPGNECAYLSPDELSELASAYDAAIGDASQLKLLADQFWAGRLERLATAKATDEIAERNVVI